jgi:sugar/nucleoside kinase (ribokinase family)
MSVVTAGEVVVDWLSTRPGDDILDATTFYRSLGGNATNVAVGLSRLETPVRLVAKIGDDLHGEYLKRALQRESVDLSCLLIDPKSPTAQCYGVTLTDNEHRYYNWPRPHAAQLLSPEDIRPEMFDGSSFLHVTGISFTLEPRKSAIEKAIQLAGARSNIVSFDANFPTDVADEILRSVDAAFHKCAILKFNEHEVAYWAENTDTTIEQMGKELFERYRPSALFVTLGPEGSIAVTNQGVCICPAYEVDCVSGIGAGDGFVAGLLHSLDNMLGPTGRRDELEKLSLSQWKEATMFANAVGALATTMTGAAEALPTKSQVAALMSGGKLPFAK